MFGSWGVNDCDCTDCNGTRSIGKCLRAEAGRELLRTSGNGGSDEGAGPAITAGADSDSALDYFSAEGGNDSNVLDDVRWGNVANWRTLGKTSAETPAKKAQNALAQREKDAERNSRELLQMLDDEKAASISKSKKKKKKKKSPSKSKWGRDNGVGAAAAASAAGAGASTGAAGGCGFGGGADGVDSPDEGDGDSASLRSVSSVVSVSSYTSAAAALAHEKNKELQDRLSSLGQVLRDEKDLKQQAHREHSRREDKLLEQIAQLQKKVSTLSEEKDATARSASKKLAASDALAARAEALAEEAVAGAKDAADLAVAEHIVSQHTLQFRLPQEEDATRVAWLREAARGAPLGHVSWPLWDGQGNPTLLHLSHAVHVVLPHLVASLVQQTGIDNCMLVGACAWMGRTKYPLTTEDMDFSIFGPDDDMDLNAIITQACEDAAKVPEVVQALSMLEAVSTAYRKRRQPSGAATDHADSDALRSAIRAAEVQHRPAHLPAITRSWRSTNNNSAETADADTRDAVGGGGGTALLPLPPLPGAAGSATSTNGGGGANASYFKDFFRIGRNHLGWKVRIMHMTLVDVTRGGRTMPFDCAAMPVAQCLPGAFVYAASAHAQALHVNVAPLSMLVEKMKDSLDSGHCWRLKTDIVRLRAVSHALWMQLHTNEHTAESQIAYGDAAASMKVGPYKRVMLHMTAMLDRLKELLAIYDPQWENMLNVLDISLPPPFL